jgi:O-antigen/teichoic acid export membrane protein
MTGENVFKAGAVGLVGSAFSAVSALLVTVVIGHSLGTSGTGIFYQVVAVFMILTAVLQLGTGSALIWAMSQRRATGRAGGETRIVALALGPVIVASVVVSVVVYLGAGPLAAFLSRSDADVVERVLRLLAWFVVPATLMGVLQTAVRIQRGALSFEMLQDVAVGASRLVGVAIAAAVGATVYRTIGYWVATVPLWMLVSAAWLVGPMVHDLRASRRVPPQDDDMTGARFWRFSSARAVGVAIEFGLDWVDVLVVAAVRSPAEAGVYAVASRCVQAGRVVDRAVRVGAAPSISWHLARREHQEASELHISVTRVAVLLSWPFYLTLIVMGPAVLGLFGPGFRQGAFVVGLLGVVMMLVVTTGMLQSIMLMGGRSTWQVYNKSVVLALSLVGNLVLVPRIGISGAAWTWAVVAVIDTAIAGSLVHYRMGVHLAPLRLVKAGLVPLAVYGAAGTLLRLVTGTSTLDLAMYLVVLTLVYAAVLWVLRERLELDVVLRAGAARAPRERVAS